MSSELKIPRRLSQDEDKDNNQTDKETTKVSDGDAEIGQDRNQAEWLKKQGNREGKADLLDKSEKQQRPSQESREPHKSVDLTQGSSSEPSNNTVPLNQGKNYTIHLVDKVNDKTLSSTNVSLPEGLGEEQTKKFLRDKTSSFAMSSKLDLSAVTARVEQIKNNEKHLEMRDIKAEKIHERDHTSGF